MATEIKMPQGGQDIEVGRVVRWLKAVGDVVKEGETLCEVETEKAVFEVTSPCDGYLRKIIVPEGDETPILSVIGYIGDLTEEIAQDAGVQPSWEVEKTQESTSQDMRPGGARHAPGEEVEVSPRARRLADERGVSLHAVRGTGAGGRIMEKDVLAFLEQQAEKPTTGATPYVDGGRVMPMSKVQGVTARRMQESKQAIPHFYLSLSVDMTEALQYRKELNERTNRLTEDQIKVTDLVVRACVLAFQVCPSLNSSVLDAENVVIWADLNIGLAVAVGDELVVPVIESPSLGSLGDIAKARRSLVAKVKEGKQPSLAPGRFTISNLGAFNIDQFLAIINPPETAILAVSTIKKCPVALGEDSIGLRDVVILSLSIDHRAVNGVVACRFLNAVKSALEDPASLG